jgi:hypothetical protein
MAVLTRIQGMSQHRNYTNFKVGVPPCLTLRIPLYRRMQRLNLALTQIGLHRMNDFLKKLPYSILFIVENGPIVVTELIEPHPRVHTNRIMQPVIRYLIFPVRKLSQISLKGSVQQYIQ